MMALCVVANGWSDNGGDVGEMNMKKSYAEAVKGGGEKCVNGDQSDSPLSSSIISANSDNIDEVSEPQGRVDSDGSPISVNEPPCTTRSPVKLAAKEEATHQDDTKHHKAASGTREEIKTSDYIKYLDMNIFTLKPDEINGALEQVQTWQELLKTSDDTKNLSENAEPLCNIATNLIAPINIKLDQIDNSELLNIIHDALMDYIDFDPFRSSLNLSCYTKNLDDELNKKAIKRELNKIVNSEYLLKSAITDDYFFSLIYELKNCKAHLTQPIQQQLICRARALSESDDQEIDKATELSAGDDQDASPAIDYILAKIYDLYT